MQTVTRWYHFIAYFFGGAFLANTIPHLANGISGRPFQSPSERVNENETLPANI